MEVHRSAVELTTPSNYRSPGDWILVVVMVTLVVVGALGNLWRWLVAK